MAGGGFGSDFEEGGRFEVGFREGDGIVGLRRRGWWGMVGGGGLRVHLEGVGSRRGRRDGCAEGLDPRPLRRSS